MRITALQKLIGIVVAIGLAYLVCDYYHLLAGEPVYSLQGRICLRGRPLPKGTIHFIPVESEHNKNAGGTIVNGDYVVPKQYGLAPGKYQVQVSSLRYQEVARMLEAQRDGEEVVEIKEEVPDRYNAKSEIYIDLTKGDVLEMDLDLK